MNGCESDNKLIVSNRIKAVKKGKSANQIHLFMDYVSKSDRQIGDYISQAGLRTK